MRRPRRILLAAATSAGVLTVVVGLVSALRGLLGGEAIADSVELPLELVGAIAAFTVLVTALSTLREATLRSVAFVSVLCGVGVAAWLIVEGGVSL